MRPRMRPADRETLELVSRAVFENPFGDARHEVDLRLAELHPSAARGDLLARVVAKVEARLSALADGARIDVRAWTGRDRELVEQALLFLLFHRHADACDAHIEAQLAAGRDAEPLPAAFARELHADLEAHGFSREAAARYVAIVFQMRRAFDFVDRRLVGGAPCMRRLRQSLWANVLTHDVGRYDALLHARMEDFSTILLGETGTGKGEAAAAIGRSSFIPYDPRRGRFTESFAAVFVAVNLAQFPASLLESELFGHERGAFTGAVRAHEGVFARCRPHGAVFLDEIGDIEVPVQIKLLRVLQEREYTPVGSHEVRRFSGRVIAATHQDLDARRRDGRFRDDLFYRLSSDVIEMPPLRQRLAEDPGELPRLVQDVVGKIVGQHAPEVTDDVLAAIARDLPRGYAWPGNVRELEQCVRRVLLTRRYTGDGPRLLDDAGARLHRAIDTGELEARELVAAYCRMLHARHGTYEEVARRTGLDRRTVKRHVDAGDVTPRG
jgi:DNA-binding NtrC family response regulator